MTDTEENPFGSEQLKGSNYLMYFGFSKCPDVCPTMLRYMLGVEKAMQKMAGEKDEKLKIVFASVDPARDTPQVLKEYLSTFNS